MPHVDEDGYLVDDYEGWLGLTGIEDTKESRGWYDCPDDSKSEYIRDHQDWWDNLE